MRTRMTREEVRQLDVRILNMLRAKVPQRVIAATVEVPIHRITHVRQKNGIAPYERRGRPNQKARDRKIAREYEAGASLEELGIKYDRHRETLSKIVQNQGVKLRNRGPRGTTKDRDDEMERLYRTGEWTLQRIGEKFGVSRARVQQILKLRNVPVFVVRERLTPIHELPEREIVLGHLQGKSLSQLATEYNTEPRFIRDVIHKAGVEVRQNHAHREQMKLTDEGLLELWRLPARIPYETKVELSQRLGITLSFIKLVLTARRISERVQMAMENEHDAAAHSRAG